MGLLGQPLDGAHQPTFQFGLRALDEAYPQHAFGGPLGQGQRNERSAEAENGRKNQQAARAALHQMHAEYILDDEQHQAEQCEHRKIGQDKQENAFHGASDRRKRAAIW